MVPKEMSARAVQAASRLADDEVGVEHYVLALLHPEAESAASTALEELGVTYEGMMELLSARESPGGSPTGSWTPSEHSGRIQGTKVTVLLAKAEGIAIGLGRTQTRPEDVLLALVWGRIPSDTERLLERLGASRKAIVASLARHGVTLPGTALPRRIEWGGWTRITEEEFAAVRAQLKQAGTLYRTGVREEDGTRFISIAQR